MSAAKVPRANSEDRHSGWKRDTEYLASLNLHTVIAEYVRISCRRAHVAESIANWVKMDNADLDGLADAIAIAIRDAWKVQTTLSQGAVPKFMEKLELVHIEYFHRGLENIIGYPPTHADFLDAMRREHEQGEEFSDRKGREFDPKVEWNIVMRSDTLNIKEADCDPVSDIPHRDCGKPLAFYAEEAKKVCHGSECDVLTEAEVAALRLWTGPMHNEYAKVLRKSCHQTSSVGGPYVATLHAINSGITKLARKWTLPANRKVYRGYRCLTLKDLKEDAFRCVGGVEKCVLATSEEMNVAIDYSEDGAFILEINVGQVNRGADVSWLSQFPHEKEVLFNALSNVEFVGSPQLRYKPGGGSILVYEVCVSANLRSKTLEQFVTLRKDLHLHMVDVHVQQALQNVHMLETGTSQEFIKTLANKCREQADAITNEANAADVGLFNTGTPAYLGLVDTAIMFPTRSIEIMNMALHWFKTQKADQAALDQLQGWQLQALRAAVEVSKPPKVTTIALEEDLKVDSLFDAWSLNLGAFDDLKVEVLRNLAKLLSINPKLECLELKIASATAETWEAVFYHLCPGRPNLRINGFHPAQHAISTLQQLELRTLGDEIRSLDAQKAFMISPDLLLHPPIALTSLSLCGTPISCTGALSLCRAFTGLQGLRYLDLRSCRIARRGCTGIAKNLCALTELQDLKLALNMVDDTGFSCLASTIRDVVSKLARLKSVDMRFNRTELPSLQRGRTESSKDQHFPIEFNCSCIEWSPGGDQIASGSRDPRILSDSRAQSEQVLGYNAHTGTVNSIAWRPGGEQIVSGGYVGRYSFDQGETIIWDAKTGDRVSTLKGHTAEVTSVAWRPGGDQIACGSVDKTIIIWDAKTGEQISTLKGHTDRVTSVAWRPGSAGHPGGDQIVSGGFGGRSWRDPGEIIIWDAKTGNQVSTLKGPGHTAAVTSVAWRPGGDQIASGSDDNTIIIWDAKTGEQVSTLKGHYYGVNSVAWRPGGDQIASASFDNTIIIWDTKTGEQVSTRKGHKSGVTSVAWRPGGDQIASGFYDKIIIWDVKTGDQVSTFKGITSVNSVASYHHNSSTYYGKPILIWNVKLCDSDHVSKLTGHSNTVMCVAWSPGADQIATGSGDKTIIIWDAQTGRKVSKLEGHSSPVTSVAWNGDRIASGSSDNTVIIWDARTKEQTSTLKGHIGWVWSVAWRPGGNQISSASYDKTIIIWDARTGDQISTLQGHDHFVTSVAWRFKGDRIASASWDKTIIIWDADSWNKALTLRGHTQRATSVAWSPRGDQIASGSADKTIIIWDARKGTQVSRLKGHSCVTSVAWSPSDDRIASGSHTNSIMVWGAKTGDKPLMLIGHTDRVRSVAWSSSGDRIASASDDKTIIIRDAKQDESASWDSVILPRHRQCSRGGGSQSGKKGSKQVSDTSASRSSDHSIPCGELPSWLGDETSWTTSNDVISDSLLACKSTDGSAESQGAASTLQNGVIQLSDAAASESVTMRAASRSCGATDDVDADTDAGCCPPPAKKKKNQ